METTISPEIETLISELETFDPHCPLCKKEKKSRWFIAEEPWWIVEDIDPHGEELCILACYWTHGNVSEFKMEVLECALRKIADKYLQKPYKIHRVQRSAKGHSFILAMGKKLTGEKE